LTSRSITFSKRNYTIGNTLLSTISPRSYTKFNKNNPKIREIKEETSLINNFNQIRTIHSKANKLFLQKTNQSIDRFKTENLQIIFDKIYKNENLEEISPFLREKLIIPTCNILNTRNLDFNFDNFSVIASEILNNFFLINIS
jgi:hypothetical protein